MADYIYLLHTRLTAAQQTALEQVREAARAHGMTVFLVGGAVRDLTSGSPIRDLDVVVQGNALKLRKELEKVGGVLIGENDQTQSLYFNFPRGVRMEVGSTLTSHYPKPGKPVYRSAGILDDLRRRDFTANAMAVSLNEGSFGLLMDPLNGVADIENRELRLVSIYGFIEDPSRMVRAARLLARLGWQMEEKTQQRYETGKAEGHIGAIAPAQIGYEIEEVFHEEDPLRVVRRLEAEGWAKVLFPAWTSAKANEPELDRLRDIVGQMEAMGIYPDPSAAYFPLLTAKLGPKDVAALKHSFARQGFVDQIAALEPDTKALAAQMSGKAAAAPSEAWKMLFASAPEPVLWLAHTAKTPALQARFKAFFSEWSQARQKIPYQLMQEMRITPELAGYEELLEQLFFAIMDAKLETPEAARAFLEPFSPPAPPPPINLRRRAVKRETKPARPRAKKAAPAKAGLAASAEGEATGAATATAVAEKTVAGKSAPAATAPAKAAAQQQTAKAPAKQVAKSPAKQAAKAPAKQVAKAPAKQAAKAPAKQATKAPGKQPVKVAAKSVAAKAAAHKAGGHKAAGHKAAGNARHAGAVKKATAVSKTATKPAATAKKAAQRLVGTSAAKTGGKKAPLAAKKGLAVAKKVPAKPTASKAAAKKPVKKAAQSSTAAKKVAGKSKPSGQRSAASPARKAAAKNGSKPKPKGRR